MFGFLNIHKEKHCTSHDVISVLRKKLLIKKIGHAGTLDPMATGVLVIGVGNATRLFEYLKNDKEYIAEMQFGIETDSDDITGNIINLSKVMPTKEGIENILSEFMGEIMQKPPIYSAIKIKGKKSYELARKNEISLSQMKERMVNISFIKLLKFEGQVAQFHISCSNGTYIRSLARDMGHKLNTFCTLTSLERIRVGDFKITNSIKLSDVTLESMSNLLVDTIDLINLEAVILKEEEIKPIYSGMVVDTKLKGNHKYIKLVNEKNVLIGIGEVSDGLIKPKKVFYAE